MRRILLLTLVLILLAAPGFATYIVVLKDGTRYKAKERWKVTNGQAIITLETGSVIQVDPQLIDEAATEQTNRLGLGDARLLAVENRQPQASSGNQQEPLGSRIKIRQPETKRPSTPATPAPAVVAPPQDSGAIPSEVVRKFTRAYDNVGLYDAKVTSMDSRTLRVQLTADNEDEVFKAISASAFLMLNLNEIRIDTVHLFMGTLNGGSAGRFQMTRDDAKAINEKQISWQNYYVRSVIF